MRTLPSATTLITPPRFAIAFGLTGIAGAWDAAARQLAGSSLVGWVLAVVAAAVLVALLTGYVAGLRLRPEGGRADLSSPVLFPFFALPIVSAELLVSRLVPVRPTAMAAFFALAALGAVVAVVHLARLISGRIEARHLHGGHLLPSVAGTIVPALVLARWGWDAAAIALLAIGLALAGMFAGLLVVATSTGHSIPAALRPTLAILVAPPALGGSVAIALHGDQRVVAAFGAATLLMLAVQLALVPSYRAAGFSPSFWSFTFPLAAAVGFGISALGSVVPSAGWTALAVATIVIAAIAAATVRSEWRALSDDS